MKHLFHTLKTTLTSRLLENSYGLRLLLPVIFLVCVGVIMVYSASSALALQKFGTDLFFLKRQVMYAGLGFGALLICWLVPYRFLTRLAYPLLGVSLIFLLLVLLTDLGLAAGGARRWLRLGALSFQPVELVRLSLIIYLAYSISKKTERIAEFSIGVLPHLMMFSLLASLILLQPDFGSVLIIGVITLLMLFAGGVPLRYLVLITLPAVPIAALFIHQAAYRSRRIISFLNPWEYAANEGYQIVHSLMAFGTGGFWGTGIGNGYQKLFYLPEPHTDFIFAVIGEELGFMGVMLILLLYGLIVWSGIDIARKSPHPFGRLLAFGLTLALGLQICINMAMTLGLLPTKGLPLPFLSYGGTSLFFCLVSVGILLNISHDCSQTFDKISFCHS